MLRFLSLLLTTSVLCAADLTDDVSQLTQDHTRFAFSLYSVLDTAETNLVFSPYSISNCLSMVYLGARGETESQMQQALSLSVERKNLAKASCLLNRSLLPADKGYKLAIANALWIDQETFLLADFRFAIQEQFKAVLNKLNFAVTDQALSTINGWISQQTEGKIPHLLNTGDISAETRLVLTNAVYFQGSWCSAFDPKATQDWPFYPSPDTSTTVKMMHQTALFPYYENELLQAAALPFAGESNGGGTLAFLLLLPKSAENFSTMVSELPDEFNAWLSSLSSRKVELKLPKFTFDYRIDLQGPLESLKMEDAFGSDANFIGIDGMRDLFLNKVVHEAFFALDENGVTAAAATAAAMNATSAPEKSPPIQLIADHPFLFLIVDLKSQEVLFMGKMR